MGNKVYVVTMFYDNEEGYTALRVEKVFDTAEKATEYVKGWQVPAGWGEAKVEEVSDLVSETDIRVVRVNTGEDVYSGVYYFSVTEREVE